MRVSRALPIALVLAGMAGPAAAQAADLPAFTAEQRWERAAMHTSLFAVLLLREAAEHGRTAEDVGRDVAAIFGPGWSGTTPMAMARAIRRNWLIWPDAEWEIQDASDTSVRFRVNRPWRSVFDEDGMLYGVREGDMSTLLRVFHEGIAERLGMTYNQTQNGDWLEVTITRP